jgi:cobalt/nickel transport system permease protein
VCAVIFAFFAATARDAASAALPAAAALLIVAMARIPLRAVARRLLPLNAFMVLLVLLLPLSVPGRSLITVGQLSFSLEGLRLAGLVALKGNAVILFMVGLIATMDIMTLGHALHRLWVPAKLVQVFLFTARYIEVLHHKEYDRLVRAMRARHFVAKANRHTYRSVGYLVGMLMVRSFDRSERILRAMKSRGFHGELFMLDHFAWQRRDTVFAGISAVASSAVIWMRYTL